MSEIALNRTSLKGHQNSLPKNSSPTLTPLAFLLGNFAELLRAQSVPGINLMDKERRIIGFELQAAPVINGASGEWLYRETGGALVLAIKVERIDSHGAGRFTAMIRNAGADVRRLTIVKFQAAFDWDQADWQVRESAGKMLGVKNTF